VHANRRRREPAAQLPFLHRLPHRPDEHDPDQHARGGQHPLVGDAAVGDERERADGGDQHGGDRRALEHGACAVTQPHPLQEQHHLEPSR
jgi:hypothetical protein